MRILCSPSLPEANQIIMQQFTSLYASRDNTGNSFPLIEATMDDGEGAVDGFLTHF